ncbi:MAG: Ku protein [Gemmatales bacterium]
MPSSRSQSGSLRPSWKGFLRFSLVTIPVTASNAKAPGEKIELNWLHKTCLSRIQYKKVCPIHGEVGEEEIISGYQLDKEHYVPIEKYEIAELHTQREDSINVDVMIKEDELDPLYLGENTYYLLPDGKAADKPYIVFQRALHEAGCFGIAQVVLFKKEQMVLIRPIDELLVMSTLHYESEFRLPREVQHQLPKVKPTSKEMTLAKNLIESSIEDKFDYSTYHDQYTEKLHQLIDAKSKGKKLKVRQAEPKPVTIDFAEALKKSLAKATGRKSFNKPISRTRHRKVS